MTSRILPLMNSLAGKSRTSAPHEETCAGDESNLATGDLFGSVH